MRTMLQLAICFLFVMQNVVSAQNDCGNTSFSGPNGIITSPDLPLQTPQNLSCTYSIDVGRNNSVQLKFIDFDLESSIYDSCIHDWLTITCNETDDENLDFTQRSCGTTVPGTSLWFFNCPVVTLKFFADFSVSGGGFSIEYKVFENANLKDYIYELNCGDTVYKTSSGFIRLPSNPTEYSARVNCTYTVSTNQTSVFSLGVTSFQQPQLIDSFVDCSRDVIMIGCVSDGETELNPNRSQTFCRRSFDVQPSRVVLSNCSIVKISIRSSDYNYRGVGSIPFTVRPYDEDCGSASLFSGPTGVMNSPRFPLSYPHNLECVYFFDVHRTTTVKLNFLSFKFKVTSRTRWGQDDCTDSWLTFNCVLDGNSSPARQNQNRKYCGEKLTPMSRNYSNCDYLSVNFAIANTSDNTRGFQLRYTIVSPGNTTTSTPDKDRVKITLTDSSGFITSPQFPLHYPNNVDYVYSFVVNGSSRVGLYFYAFDLEGTSHPSSHYPSHYPSYNSDICYFDWLTISVKRKRYRSYYYENKTFCGERTTPLILSYIDCENLLLNFASDSTITSSGFKIWYTIASTDQSDCGNTSFNGPSGTVTSPNFPLPYPNNLNCTYSIDAGRNSSVQLKFTHFSLEMPNSMGHCAHDWLKISCSGTTMTNRNSNKKYCGSIQWTSSMRFFDCSSLDIEFVTNANNYYYSNTLAFMIEYTVIENSNAMDDSYELDCGTTMFTDSTGVIKLPRNPTNFLATVNCTYTIWTNRTSVAWLNSSGIEIMNQLLQSFQDCSKESLKISCISEEGAELNTTRVYCRRLPHYRSMVNLPFSGCGALKLSIHSDTYDYREAFLIPFKVYGPNDVCGNTTFSAPTGNISSVRFPFHHAKPVNCLYTIDSGQVSAVVLGIDRLNFGYWYQDSNAPCANGWFTITCMVNGTSVPHPLANKKICAFSYHTENLITARFSACRSVLLNYFYSSMSDHGFSLRYRLGDHELDCGETLFTNSSGVINLPRNPTNYPARVNCTYTISTDHLRYIWLNATPASATQFSQSLQDCNTEWMMVGCVREGETGVNPSTSVIFCKRHQYNFNGLLVFADCRTVKLSIRSYTYDYRETFRIPFSVIGQDNICGNASFSNSTGYISSPQLPFQYSKRVNCLYTIDHGSVNSVVFSLNRLSLPGSSELCDSGMLTITGLVNGSSMVQRKFCVVRHYSYSIAEGFPACRSILLNFSSNYISSESQFSLRYKWGSHELDCGTTLFTNTSGVINLPRNTATYPATVNCTYTISTTGLSHFWLNANYNSVNRFLQSFQECEGAGVTIGCLAEGETELNHNTTMVFCRNRQIPYRSEPLLLFIDCRTLKLSIRSIAFDYRETMNLAFNVFEPSVLCGNTSFSAPYGVVSSPRLPSSYPKAVNCLYVIESDYVNSVVLNVDRLIPGSRYGWNEPCNNSWLMITCLVNGTSMAHSMADRKLCSIQSPVVISFPACRSVLLNFSIGYTNHEGTGFTVRYRTGDYNDPGCGDGPTSFRGSTGVITSPPHPTSRRSHNLDCLYSIAGAQNATISVTFISFTLNGQSLVPDDNCFYDWLTVGCLSDRSAAANISSSTRYCGSKSTPLKFSFPNCEVAVLNYRRSLYTTSGLFKAIYKVTDTVSLCGVPVYGPPSGVISFPQNNTDSDDSFDCKYVINATQPSSISLTILSISLQSSVGRNCQRDWLLFKGIDGQIVSKLNISHRSCNHLNSSLQLIFPGCTKIEVDFHRDSEATGKTFRIEYTVASYVKTDGNIAADELTMSTTATSVSTAIPVTANCEVGCEISKDGTSCDCPTTQPDDAVDNTDMNSRGRQGYAVGISLGLVLLVAGAICLGALLLFRRIQKKNHSEMLVHETEEERAQRELDAESTKSELSCGADRNQDGDTSRYLPLRPISQVGHEEPSSSTNSTQNLTKIEPGL